MFSLIRNFAEREKDNGNDCSKKIPYWHTELRENTAADKGYARPFANDQRQVFKIGINFSTKTKLIDDWAIEQ